MARPKGSNFTQEMGDEILAGIAEGNSLRTVLKAEGMPCMSTVFKWLREEAGFSENYEKALASRADAFGEDILAIADNTENDTHTTTYADGVERTSPNTEWISRSRLRVDARKWLASKHHPKRYGDMVTQKVTGADGGPLTISWKKADEE